MKSLDTGKDKVKKICEVLQKETLDPARKEADEIIASARLEAEKILEEAKLKGNRIIIEAKGKIKEERNIFQASINLASKKCLDTLKQEVEENLFNKELSTFVGKHMQDPQIIANIISCIIKGIEKDGIDGDLQALISNTVSKDDVNKELVKGMIDRLKLKSVEIGDFFGGAQVKIINKNLTIEMTDNALKTLLAKFVREDFRSIIFAS